MFQNVLLDNKQELPEHRKRFYSCVSFVADQCNPAFFYLNSDWSKEEAIRAFGLSPDNLTSKQITFFEEHDLLPSENSNSQSRKIVCLKKDEWDDHTDGDAIPIIVPSHEFVLSDSEIVNKGYLLDIGLNPTTAILTLAAVGLDLMLPNVNFDLFKEEEILNLKEQFGEERADYLSVVTNISREAYERILDGDMEDLVSWAETRVAFDLLPQARILTESTKKAPQKTLKAAGAAFWKDGIPAIGSAYFVGGIGAAGKELASQSLRTLTNAIAGDASMRSVPEFSYAMKIQKANA